MGATKTEGWQRALDLLGALSITGAEKVARRYPHQMSGGMKQRVIGAIAISSTPKVIIADEPTTALDVTIQLQYLQLLREIQEETGLAIIFITHDFGIVARMCDRVAVMYAGRIIESGDVRTLFNSPTHPYTQALMASVPQMDRTERLFAIDGQPPALFPLPEGCRFAARCSHVKDHCTQEYPPTGQPETGHNVSCWMVDPTWDQTPQEAIS